jgi:uncharacterized DUF497 family protein
VGSYDFDGFEWDEQKSEATFRDRGIDFDTAAQIFAGPTLQQVDTRMDYGEIRYIAIGETDGITVTVIWTLRARLCRIITAWPATRREERSYNEYCQKIDG